MENRPGGKDSALTWTLRLGLMAVALLPRPGTATVLVPATLAELAEASTVVALGQARDLESRWNEDRTAIFTVFRFEIEEVLVGEPLAGDVVPVQVPGGRIGDLRTVVLGAPGLEIGTRMVLVLDRLDGSATPEPSFAVVGLVQGAFDLHVDAETQRTVAVSQAVGLFEEVEEGVTLPGGRRGIPLDELRERLRNPTHAAPTDAEAVGTEAVDPEATAAAPKDESARGAPVPGREEEASEERESEESGHETGEPADPESDEAAGGQANGQAGKEGAR